MRFFAVVTLALVAALAPAAQASELQRLEDAGVRQIIVRRAAGLDAAQRTDVRADAGARFVRHLRLGGYEVVRVPAGELTEAVGELSDDPRVREAEADAPVRGASADPFLPWGLGTVRGPEAWSTTTGTGVKVAVVDSGLKLDDPDLAGRVRNDGFDYIGNDATPADEHGHGTHVTGTIAASAENGIGIPGLAPSVDVTPIRVLDSANAGTLSGLANGFDLAGDLGIRVVNASISSSGSFSGLDTAITSHPNTLYVVAAGNGGADGIGDNVETTATYPCRNTAANVLCVGAATSADGITAFSNYGTTSVDLFAPGQSLWSGCLTGYCLWSGTSMATPHVTGVAALLLAQQPSITVAELKAALMNGGVAVPAFATKSVSGRRLDAVGAFAQRGVTVSTDDDGDGDADSADNCRTVANASQADLDGDADGDACDDDRDGDGRTNASDALPDDPGEQDDLDGDGTGDHADTDDDNDGDLDGADNCPADANADQANLDGDATGDACDPDIDGDGRANASDDFPSDADEQDDTDGDGVGDNADNCPSASNAGQANLDGDATGDACDGDRDGDGRANASDAFPSDPAEQDDTDGDGTGNAADLDDDNDGTPDAQDTTPLGGAVDGDGDGVADGGDNCAAVANASQADLDGDGDGDACDTDRDGDGRVNTADAFPANAAEWSDFDGDGTGDNADLDDDGDGVGDALDASPLDPTVSTLPAPTPEPTPAPEPAPEPEPEPTPTPAPGKGKPPRSKGSGGKPRTVALKLSGAATLEVTVAAKTCKKAGCRSTWRIAGKKGANTIALRGRGGRKLAPGRYVVRIVRLSKSRRTVLATRTVTVA